MHIASCFRDLDSWKPRIVHSPTKSKSFLFQKASKILNESCTHPSISSLVFVDRSFCNQLWRNMNLYNHVIGKASWSRKTLTKASANKCAHISGDEYY